ncbi:MAG: chemotaxis protein CheD [Chloroflexi bacterium]|nr:chemotaxis protein CheD [Chloroflexota bacterium]
MFPELVPIAVGLGEVKISTDPEAVLVAYGLGSCLGIGMYDSAARIGGMLHAVLPQRTNGDTNLSKYVDTGVPEMVKKMLAAGARREHLMVRVAGGANMLLNVTFAKTLNIGERNVAAAQEVFTRAGLNVLGQEVGGSTGRTVRLYVADGRMTVRMMGGREREVQ